MDADDERPPLPAAEARRRALGWLARRPLTEGELRLRLARDGCTSETVEATVGDLVREGLIDDAVLAEHFIAARLERERHGPVRLVRDLVARGVDREVAESAWRRAVEEQGLDPAAALAGRLERLLAPHGGRLDGPAYRRVYNSLLRAGFPPEEIARALRPHVAGETVPADDETTGPDTGRE